VKTGLVIPTLGGGYLPHCLEAVAALDPRPGRTLVVLSGGAPPPVIPQDVELITADDRMGFAAAVNTGIDRIAESCENVALLNDDAVPAPGWLGALQTALDADSSLAAVQGTVTDSSGATIDGRGITLDAFGLPIQLDRGGTPAPEPPTPRAVLAVSGTASLFRTEALRSAALSDGSVFDPAFGSYFEDVDLGLRLGRLGWTASWIPAAWASHVGSATARRLGWRHPWWMLTNRWRALAGNLRATTLIVALPRLLRGEVRAVRTLARHNRRAPLTAVPAMAAVPWLVVRSLFRKSPGPRLTSLPVTGA
jgi:GT2 family glycosyltransferase